MYRWHWHVGGAPRVPNTVWRSSQLAWLAGTTVISGVVGPATTAPYRPWIPVGRPYDPTSDRSGAVGLGRRAGCPLQDSDRLVEGLHWVHRHVVVWETLGDGIALASLRCRVHEHVDAGPMRS